MTIEAFDVRADIFHPIDISEEPAALRDRSGCGVSLSWGDTDVAVRSDGDQAVAAADGVLVSSKSAGSKRASRRLYSFANPGHVVKFRPSAPTYHE